MRVFQFFESLFASKETSIVVVVRVSLLMESYAIIETRLTATEISASVRVVNVHAKANFNENVVMISCVYLY